MIVTDPVSNPAAADSAASDLVRRAIGDADRFIAPTYVRPDHLFVRGEGSWLEDAAGERFLDFTSGVAVNALGHASPVVTGAIERAVRTGLVHTSNLFHTQPGIDLARELVERSFATSVFFCNSGAESVEGAIKLARLAVEEEPERREVVYFDGSFHGRTFGALSATDRPAHRAPFEPLVGGFVRLPWLTDDLAAIGEKTAAVIVEPVQGEGGVRVPDPAWLRALRARCDEVGALLIFDEVQAGLGRTGALWAHEASGVVPDIMTLAKPLAGGLPMGAVLLGERPARTVRPGMHASTFGGGPLVATVALAVVRTVAEPSFLEAVARKGDQLRAELGAISSPLAGEVRGVGLLTGVVVGDAAPKVVAAAREERLLVVGAAGGVVRMIPPLNVEPAEITEGVARLARALGRVEETGEARS